MNDCIAQSKNKPSKASTQVTRNPTAFRMRSRSSAREKIASAMVGKRRYAAREKRRYIAALQDRCRKAAEEEPEISA
jgi:hypothetical protein